MISLPTLAGVPPVLAPTRTDSAAARYALTLAGAGPIARPAASKYTLEHGVLVREVQAWLDQAAAAFRFFRPHVHLTIGVPPVHCECTGKATDPVTLWLANQNEDNWDSVWNLERRWGEIERRRKGLAQTGLAALHEANWSGIPVLTPRETLGMAQFCWWAGEVDERYVLEQWRDIDDPEKSTEEHDGIPRRAWFDKALPKEASCARRIVRDATLQYAGSPGREILELREATRAADRQRKKDRFALHRTQDDLWCVGYGATLRWNGRDPTARVFDDHANGLFESCAVEHAWGYFILGAPRDLPVLLGELERRFALARLQETVIESIAERSRA